MSNDVSQPLQGLMDEIGTKARARGLTAAKLMSAIDDQVVKRMDGTRVRGTLKTARRPRRVVPSGRDAAGQGRHSQAAGRRFYAGTNR